MIRKLYQIDYYLDNKKIYDQSLGFTLKEPDDDDIKAIIKACNPFLKYDKFTITYVRELKDNEL